MTEATLTIEPVDKIEQALVRENVTERVISEMREQYLGLTISGVDDKAGYSAVRDARIKCKNTRVLAEKICKKGREAAVAEQKAWIAKEKEVSGKISEVEDYLAEQQRKIDEEKERLRLEAERKEQERIQTRINALLQYGVNIPFGTLSGMTDEQYEKTLQLSKEAFEDAERAKAEEERLRKEEEERLQREREDEERRMREEKVRMEEERTALDRQRREQEEKEAKLREEQERREAELNAEQERISNERRALQEQKIKARCGQLAGLGMVFSFTDESYLFEDINVHQTEVTSMDDSEWASLVNKITPAIEQRKADAVIRKQQEQEEAERLRIQQIEEEKQKAVEAERKRIEEEQEAERKRLALQKINEERKLALLPDKEKLLAFSESISQLDIPVLNDEKAVFILESALKSLQLVQDFIKEETNLI